MGARGVRLVVEGPWPGLTRADRRNLFFVFLIGSDDPAADSAPWVICSTKFKRELERRAREAEGWCPPSDKDAGPDDDPDDRDPEATPTRTTKWRPRRTGRTLLSP